LQFSYAVIRHYAPGCGIHRERWSSLARRVPLPSHRRDFLGLFSIRTYILRNQNTLITSWRKACWHQCYIENEELFLSPGIAVSRYTMTHSQ
jgi:hypothetical protein